MMRDLSRKYHGVRPKAVGETKNKTKTRNLSKKIAENQHEVQCREVQCIPNSKNVRLEPMKIKDTQNK